VSICGFNPLPASEARMWDVALGYFTGLRLINPDLAGDALLRTVLVVHSCDAVMCWLLAHNKGYSKSLSTGFGFVFGIWAMAVLLVLPKRPVREESAPIKEN
jgi:hypothetical protein